MSTQVFGSCGLTQEDKTVDDKIIEELSLFEGPLRRLGCRLGLVREKTNTIRLGAALGLLAWGVLMLLALLQGGPSKIFSLPKIGVHVRFLAVVPLLFVCETCVVPQMAEFARYIVRSGLVSESSVTVLASGIRRLRKLMDSWWVEGLFLLVAFLLPLMEKIAPLPGRTGSWVSILHSEAGGLTWTYGWYLGFCLPLFRFLMLRLLWALGLWWYFLWQVQKLELRMIATHSDRAAGIGYLELVQENFAPLALAISALFSAQFAEDISAGAMQFENLYSYVPTVLLLILALVIGPLCIFSRKLWVCRWTGMSAYMSMASRYVTAFDDKWIEKLGQSGASQLGSADLQALSDLTSSLNVIRNMQPIPASRRLFAAIAGCGILPMLPLLLLKYPAVQVAARLLKAVIGM